MAISNAILKNETYLLDREFLSNLDRVRNKVIYAKIIALTMDEEPVEEIQGRVTSGNVTVDGKSAVRRTCSLSLVANELNIHDYYWGLNTKFQFLIGVENNIEPKYPEIIWFKMGTYFISSFNTSQTINSYTISIAGKDKMCMLNGDIGGVITPLTWDFGTIEEIQKDGSKVVTKYLIKNIITEAVHEHAHEPWQNIIVSDLDDLALELLEYRGDKPLYLLYCLNTDMITNHYIPDDENVTLASLASNLIPQGDDQDITKLNEVHFDPRVSTFKLETNFTIFQSRDLVSGAIQQDDKGNPLEYSMIKVTYGETIGYRITELTYAGDLISNVGESVTSMLDKIVNMLGNYEYFYNVDGQFIFQRKAVYYEASWNNIVHKQDIDYHQVPEGEAFDINKMYFYKDGSLMHEYYEYDKESWEKWNNQHLMYYVTNYNNYADNSRSKERYVYSFNDDLLVTSFSNAPNLLNLKNDYSIWGVRKGVTGAEIPIHLRYAIDQKPFYYKTFDGRYYATAAGAERWAAQYDEAIELMEQQKITIVANEDFSVYKKSGVPSYLMNSDGTSDWWDLLDWAEYYKMLAGEYPSLRLKNYCTEGFFGQITYPNGDVFRATTSGMTCVDKDGNDKLGIGYLSRKTGQLIFDVNKDDYNLAWRRTLLSTGQTSTWYPLQHGSDTCNHTYSNFIDFNTNFDMRSYIYKPKIPETTTTIGDEDYVIVDDGTINTDIAKIQREKDLFVRDVHIVDWREIIYQMALDYRRHNHDDDYYLKIITNNRTVLGDSIYPKGYTGYEPYYIDLEGFWRQLYDPDYTYSVEAAFLTPQAFIDNPTNYFVWVQNTKTNLEQIDRDYYYQDYLGRYMKVNATLAAMNEQCKIDPGYYWYLKQCTSTDIYDSNITYFEKVYDEYDPESHWAKQVTEDPAGLNFWFDLLSGDSDLDRYSVRNIGDRPKAEKDDKVKAIYFRDIPNVIFVDKNIKPQTLKYEKEQRPGYSYARMAGYLNSLFTTSRQGKSAIDKLEQFLYQYACCTESITINSLPIYYLEPNTRILVDDNNSNLHGEYLIERMSIPLSNSDTMSITATKAIDRLY